ncbi:phosphodiester glycosidase family protein [Haploplasma axanthum]|uniref:Exopolysaccharide biosynthesis protein related to N-acetylglucosamine-1-phosphodiester alpha-N-acetylglucosaminidase n=1 Tax=Haploplasma axanthum TaxID=29552 RepID=A0A449BCY6_HAPAX|nr:phosphodiester glycosidase family protein [Haploplasma axanthum]VEU80314.1 Exopolysaccharide biosynthesis protein related to N-acetylglucosamine-1-phosphodiester alpha-N-acetylglucosaminidase [Haploplasma axanthum]
MKRIIFVVLLIFSSTIFLTSSFGNKIDALEYYRFDADERKTEYIDNFTHMRINGRLTLGEITTEQYYNFLDLGINQKEKIHLVSVNGFKNNGYGMMGLNSMIEVYEQENPNIEVLGGFNGDFYAINDTGEPSNLHIVDYEVVYRGRVNNSVVLAVKTDGSSSFKEVKYEGNEILVLNIDGEIKKRVKVDYINQRPNNSEDVTILFDNYKDEIDSVYEKIIVEGIDIKQALGQTSNNNNSKYYQFAKGKVKKANTTKVETNNFVVVSKELKEIVEEGDTIIFQAKVKDFEDVRYAVGTYYNYSLIVNGEITIRETGSMGTARHPRTAIGIKENGEVFVVVVDGRDIINGRAGVNYLELANIMKTHGAVQAYNFDGGGSSTLMLGNSRNYSVLNQLSDKRIRSISNGFLIVKGDIGTKAIEINTPDTREENKTPEGFYIDQRNYLHFDHVEGNDYYDVNIDGKSYLTADNKFSLNFLTEPGEYKIRVKSRGTKTKMASLYSNEMIFKVNTKEIENILKILKNISISNLK